MLRAVRRPGRGGQGAVDMALFAKAKEPFLRSFLTLANGLPSYDTFSRLFRNLDAEQFCVAFQRFMAEFCTECAGVVAIDGKVARRLFDTASSKSALHMVSAWGSEQQLVLGQIVTDVKSNEITAVPKLLRMLALKGTIVTADALNCQREIAAQIMAQQGDYALALKANQETLYNDVVLLLNDPEAQQTTMPPAVEADHGCIETRTATVSTEVKWLQEQHRWPGLQAVGKVVRVRETAEKTTTETAYYLLSKPLTPERFNEVARQHWGVEDSLHWRLDVVMNEDQDRTRMGHGLENLAVLPAGQVQTCGLGRRLPLQAPGDVLKCDCPGSTAQGKRILIAICKGEASKLRWGYGKSPEVFCGVEGPACRTYAVSSVAGHCFDRDSGDFERGGWLG